MNIDLAQHLRAIKKMAEMADKSEEAEKYGKALEKLHRQVPSLAKWEEEYKKTLDALQ